MPTYVYQCNDCDHTFEAFQRITDEPLNACEKCGGSVKKLLFPVGIVFRGSGFHVNDYGKHGKKSASESKEKTESKALAESTS